MRYDRENTIDQETCKCTICNFGPANEPDSEEMTYFDFVVWKEHMFLGSVYEKEELETSSSIENIANFLYILNNLSRLQYS